MTSVIFILLMVTLLKSSRAEMTALEKFLTSGFSKDQTSDVEQDEEKSETSKDGIIKFMKRAGVIGGDNLNPEQQRFLNALETLNPNQAVFYQSQPNQQSSLTNYVAPKRQLTTPQQQQQVQVQQQQQPQQYQPLQQQLQQQQALQTIQQLTPQQKQLLKQQLFLKLQQLQAQRQQVQQQLQSQSSSPQSNTLYPSADDERNDNTVPQVQDVESKYVSKDDRQGYYDNNGYDEGYAGAYHGISEHQDGYSAGHYVEPAKKVVFVPKPSVSIKIDPANILRLLLAGIPKPILNLNGKVFFGVELGKHAGITKGVGGYAAPAYGGGGKGVVLNLG